jgi:hypothetical protein
MPQPTTHPQIDRDRFVAAWLRLRPEPKYTSFTCTMLSEIEGSRPFVERALTEAVFVHHNDPETYRQKLAHLGFPSTAAALDRRPRSLKTRLGNFGEVLASEFLRQIRGYRIPVYRLRYNSNDESSPKGDDVLAFEFADRARGVRDTVIVAEVKVRSSFRSDVVEEAHDALLKGHRPRPKSFMFVVDVLFKEGKADEAKRLLDLSHKFGRRSLQRKSCLFLITGNQPRDPFETLESKRRLAPELEALHLPVDGLGDVVTVAFEAPVDATTL